MVFSGSFRRLTLHNLGSTLKKVGPLFVYMIRKNYICGKAKVMNAKVNLTKGVTSLENRKTHFSWIDFEPKKEDLISHLSLYPRIKSLSHEHERKSYE